MMNKRNFSRALVAFVVLLAFTALFSGSAYAAADDATLLDLAVDGETVEGFAPDTLVYDITVANDVSTVDITAVGNDAGAVISGDTGNKALTVGLNTFTISCTSEDTSASNDYVLNITREASSNTNLSYINIDGAPLQGFSNDVIAYDINVDFADDSVDIQAGAVHTNAIVSGDTGTQILQADVNTLTITCIAEDGVTTQDYVLNFTRPASSARAFSGLGFIPWDAAMDPDRNVAYVTAQGGYSLYRADLDTGDVTYLTFEYKADKLKVKDGKVFLCLLHGPYATFGIGSGTIGVIDTSSFTPVNFFDIDIDPFDIEVDRDGYVHIVDGKKNNDKVKSYDPVTGQLISTGAMTSSSYMEYNSSYNKLYSLYLGVNPRSLSTREINNGLYTATYSSASHDDFSRYVPIKVSPNGQLIFNGSGDIFTCTPTSGGDMEYYDSIYKYSAIDFDENNGVFYAVDDENGHQNYLLTYDYSTLTVTHQFAAKYSIHDIFYHNDRLVYLQRESYDGDYFFSLNPEEYNYICNVTGVSLSSSEINLMPGDKERLLQEIQPDGATNRHVTWTVSDPLVATIVDNEVFAHSAGSCEITATTLDGGFTATCTVNVMSTPFISSGTSSANGLDNLGFVPHDTELDPNEDVAYVTSEDGNKLYKVDLATGQVKYLKFIYYAEYISLKDDKLYLSLGRKYYEGCQRNGKIIVIDTNTFQMSEYIDVDYSPYDVIIDDQDFLYVMMGNNYKGIVTFDTRTWQQISNATYGPTNGRGEFNHHYDKLYIIQSASPDDLYTYEMLNGVCTTLYDSPYHGDYGMNTYIKISPDGKYVFNGTGNIFTSTPTGDGDMLFYNNIHSFTAVCFENDKFHTAYGKILKTYDYATQTFSTSHFLAEEMTNLFFSNGKIVAMQNKEHDKYYFNIITEDDYVNPYVTTGVSSANALENLGFAVQDAVIDDDNYMAYVTEQEGNRLYKIDLTTGDMQYMEFIFTAENIIVRDGKVYVSLQHGATSSEETGTIAVVDSNTFTMINHFVVEVDPYEIAVDNSGNICINSGAYYGSDTLLYDPVTGEFLDCVGSGYSLSKFAFNYQYNKVYAVNQNVSPRDLHAYEITNREFSGSHDSPYNGDYPLTRDISVSPDGLYVFNGSGNIFNCAPTQAGDMTYNGNIEAFALICYDLGNNSFFTTTDNVLKVFNYDDRSTAKQYTDENDFVSIFYSNTINNVVALKKNSSNEYYWDTTTGTGINVTSIAVDDGEVNAGETLTLNLTITPSNATNKNVLYTSSNTSVATVDANGVVTGVAVGSVTITATTQDGGFADTCTITVNQPVTSVALSPEVLTINIGDAPTQLTATVSPDDAGNKNVTYSSSNTAAATIDADGYVTAVGKGSTTITVETEDGSFTDTCDVTVVQTVTGVVLTPETLQLNVGQNSNLNAEVLPSDASEKGVTYTSSNEAVATVDAVGTVFTHAPGTATITVKTNDGGKEDTCEVTVVQPVTGVELSHENENMYVDGTLDLDENVLPSDASNKNVTYTSSNTAVATVDANGVVTAVAVGSATITVETEDGNFPDTCEITVLTATIESNTFQVNRDLGHFEDMAIGTTAQEIIDAIITSGQVRVLDPNGQQVTGDLMVSTGYVVQLLSGGEVVDELVIVIEGDLNPDGILDVVDYTYIRLHILNVKEIEGVRLFASDVNDDGIIDVIDYTLVRLHILGIQSLY